MTEIEKLEKRRHKLYDEIDSINDKIRELELSDVNLQDLKGKYIQYTEDGITNVMFVEDIMRERTRYQNFDAAWILRGIGFSGEFTGYGDATWFGWDYWHELCIYGNVKEFKEKVEKIEILTKEEYQTEFDKFMNNVKLYHTMRLERWKFDPVADPSAATTTIIM